MTVALRAPGQSESADGSARVALVRAESRIHLEFEISDSSNISERRRSVGSVAKRAYEI